MKRRNLKSLRLNKKSISSLEIFGGIPGKPPAQPIERKTKFSQCRAWCPTHPGYC
jgi:hypothetical protein